LILGLAFCDTLTILCSLATRGFPFLGIDSLEYFGSIIAPMTFPMAVTLYTGSVYTTMLLAFEQYSGIVLGKRIFYKKVYHYMVSIGLFSIIINLPLFWSFKWEEAELNLDVYCNKTFQYAALILPHAILKFIVPTLFLIFTNFFTVKEVRNSFIIVWIMLRRFARFIVVCFIVWVAGFPILVSVFFIYKNVEYEFLLFWAENLIGVVTCLRRMKKLG
jgi:hypothetical protein